MLRVPVQRFEQGVRGTLQRVAVLGACVCAFAAAALLCSCGSASAPRAGLAESTEFPTIESFDPALKSTGIVTGVFYDGVLKERHPSAQILYYSSYPDAMVSLGAGKSDAFLGDLPIIAWIASEMSGIEYVPDPFVSSDIAFGFPKDAEGDALQREFNGFLAQAESDGTLAQLREKWLNGQPSEFAAADFDGLPAPKGTITFSCSSSSPPFCLTADGGFAGFEAEIVFLFAKECGYGIKVLDSNFDGVITAVSTGKCDLAASCMSVTDERKKSILFSDTIARIDAVFSYYDPDGTGATEANGRRNPDASQDVSGQSGRIETLADLSGKRIGTLVGSSCIQISEELAGPSGKVLVFNSVSDLPMALAANKIDAYVADGPLSRWMVSARSDERVLTETVMPLRNAAAFRKDDESAARLCAEFDDFVSQLKESGELDGLARKWILNEDGGPYDLNYEDLPAVRGTIRVVTTTAAGAPLTYMLNGKLAGYDIALFTRFCEDCGYAVEYDDVDFTGAIAALASGKYDALVCGLSITEERAESVLFSKPYLEDAIVAVVPDDGASASVGGFFEGVAESFEKTFLVEDRWRLFLGGIITTLAITMSSLVFGTLLGSLVYMLERRFGRRLRRVIDFFIWLVSDMPTVVFLMILFYVVFANASISGAVVASIGFTLIFAASFVGMLRMGVGAVDIGQSEAAQALGYKKRAAFMKVILPQAIRHFLPTFKSEMISLLKGTAIVGYIAVQDLTKMGDVIRSRTYEAFFPLIAVAVIYFLLAALLRVIAGAIGKCILPSAGDVDRFLKGVDADD